MPRTYVILHLLIVLLFGINTQHAFSQAPDSVASAYTRGLRTDHWRLDIYKALCPAKGLDISFSERLTSARLVTINGDKWKDKVKGLLRIEKTFNPNFLIYTTASHFRYLDRQSGRGRDIKAYDAVLGLRWQNSLGTLPVAVGIKEDRRHSITDTGPMIRGGINLSQLKINDYIHRFRTYGNVDWLNRRNNSTLDVAYQVHRQFSGNATDTLTAGMLQQRRDYYLDSAGLIESRKGLNYQIQNRLTYPVGRTGKLRIRTGIAWRELAIHHVDKDDRSLQRKRNDYDTDLFIQHVISTQGFYSSFSIGITGNEERYKLGQTRSFSGRILATPDNRTKRTFAKIKIGYLWNHADSLDFSARIENTQYDTPDKANVDDHDELRWHTEIHFFHALSPWLKTHVRLSAHGNHLIYLSGQRSADNHWMRILRLQPSIIWTPNKRLRCIQRVNIMANYIDYDFEEMFPNLRSYLYRQLTIVDSVRYRLCNNINMVATYRLDLDENGKLHWSKWQEQRLLSRTAHAVALNFEYRPSPYWILAPGLFWYRRLGYQYTQGSEKLSSDFQHWGPSALLTYKESGLICSIYVQWNRTKLINSPSQNVTRVRLRCSWML
ncbi:hypothetical protein KAR48_17515 [bacterium]|nr:hypothetical protein [bacterium]